MRSFGVASNMPMVPVRRALLALAVLGLIMALALPAHAAQKRAIFVYGQDRASWFWLDQESVQVGGPDFPGGVAHRQKLPSPQATDTLPVAVRDGDLEKASALFIDLAARGLVAGSTITKLTVSIVEGTDPSEQPPANEDAAAVVACPADDFWPSGDAEEWENLPTYVDTSCAKGRHNDRTDPATWSFDLTQIAQPWGTDPFGNNGVVLIGDARGGGATETWQINMKIPSRDDSETPETDEYKETKNRVKVTLVYDAPATDTGDLFDSSSGSGSTFTPTSGFTPSTSFTPADTATTAPTTPAETTPPAVAPPVAAPVAETGPHMPGYVWALIPLGLMAISALRSAVFEPVAGMRSDGVVAAIRRRNAERRGVPAEEMRVGTARSVRQAFARARSWMSKVAGSVRRR